MYKLIKFSTPGWEKPADSYMEVIKMLRGVICKGCLEKQDSADGRPIDIKIGDTVYECFDANVLLSTPCGCEYGIEDGGDI